MPIQSLSSRKNLTTKVNSLLASLLSGLVLVAMTAPMPASAADGTVTVACPGGGSFDLVTTGSAVETRNGSTCSGALAIPDGVTSIGVASFIGSGLTSVAFPASVATIDVVAFQAATSLATISFAAGSQLTAINQEAFRATAIVSLPVPASVTSIRYDIVDNVPNFESFEVDPASASFADVDGVLFNKNQTQLIKYPIGKSGITFTVPSSVIEIGAAAVRDTGLTSVVFSENSALTTIGPSAFAGSSALTSIKIPEGVTTIHPGAFAFSPALISATIPSTVIAIPPEMFISNISLRSVVFSPNSQVALIGLEAFANTPSLKDLLIPASVSSIGDRAFLGALEAERRLYFAGTKPSFGQLVFHEANGEALNKRIYVSSATSWEDHVSRNEDWVQGVNVTLGFYSVTFSSSPGTAVDSAVRGANRAIAEPSRPTRTGYTFDGWWASFDDNEPVTFPYNPGVNAATTLYASWAEVEETERDPVSCTTGTFELVTRGDAVIVENGQTCAGLAAIPAAVTSIAPEAFYPGEVDGSVPRTALAQISFAPNSRLEQIGDRAFRGSNLTAIELPATLRIIGQEAFTDVPLTSVTFGENSQLETIGEAAFQGTSISSIYLPSSTASIGQTAFAGNVMLIDLSFGNGSTPLSIGDSAFSSTPLLVDVVLPTRVAALGSNAFSRDDQEMKNFYFLGNKPATIGDDVFAGFNEETAKVYVSSDFNAQGYTWNEPSWLGADGSAIADILLGFFIVDLIDVSRSGQDQRIYGRSTGLDQNQSPMIEAISEPVALTRSGYTFAGWSETQGGAAVTFPYVPEVDTATTLYASWNAAQVSTPQPNPSSSSSSGSATAPTFSISARPTVSANGQSLTLRGGNLGSVTRVRVGGKDAKISKKADGELIIEIPAGSEGFPDVEITHSGGTVSMQGLIQVVAPYVAVRTVKITQFVGNRPTRAGLAKLEQAYLAGTTANQLTCVATVASDASSSAIKAATKRAKATCASVVKYSKYIKSADVHVSKDGARGSKLVLAVTFDKAMPAE